MRISDWGSDVCSSDLAGIRSAAVEATVKYIVDTGEKRLIYRPSQAGRDDSVWAGRYEDRRVAIEDARDIAGAPDIDRQGFALVRSETAVTDFFDDGQVAAVWGPEEIGSASCRERVCQYV